MEEIGRDPMVAILENYVRTLEEEAEMELQSAGLGGNSSVVAEAAH